MLAPVDLRMFYDQQKPNKGNRAMVNSPLSSFPPSEEPLLTTKHLPSIPRSFAFVIKTLTFLHFLYNKQKGVCTTVYETMNMDVYTYKYNCTYPIIMYRVHEIVHFQFTMDTVCGIN